MRATLHLREVCNTFDVSVNGVAVPCNQSTGTAELTNALKQGKNTLSVRVVSSLYNRLVEVYPEQYGKLSVFGSGLTELPRQEYGCSGAEINLVFV